MQILTLINSIAGGVLLSGGAITAYADTFGASRWVSAIFGGFGLVQIISANIIHALTTNGGKTL